MSSPTRKTFEPPRHKDTKKIEEPCALKNLLGVLVVRMFLFYYASTDNVSIRGALPFTPPPLAAASPR
jgi:hypothetical protein